MIYPHDSLSTVPINDLVRICGVDITTARRWRKGSNLPPSYVLAYVNAHILRDLGLFDPAWRGWKLWNGCLESPEGWQMTMGDVMASRLHEAQLRAWRHEVLKLKMQLADAELNRLEEQPTPDEWDVQILYG